MAMHEHFASLLDHELHYLNDVEELIELRMRQVLPVAVEVRNLAVHEKLRRVRKTCLRDDAIATERVLARLLQIENRSDPLPKQSQQ